jgi:hypothetical protein
MIAHSQKKPPTDGFLKPNFGDQGNPSFTNESLQKFNTGLRMQTGIASHSFSAMPVLSPGSLVQPNLKINAPGNQYEQAANRVEEQLPAQPNHNEGAFTKNGSKTGTTKLSEAGQRFYQPFVGSAVDNANLHIGGQADELAKLSKAKALTFGNDVYIPENRFAPESSEGRALIGHELAHVGQSQQAPTQVFRDEEEPHYPSVEEQAKIEKLLGRQRTAITKVTETVGENGEVVKHEEVIMTGRNLTGEERIALADKLKAPFNDAITKMIPESQGSAPIPAYSDDQVYDIAEKAKKGIYAKFGKYISRSVTLTRIDTSVEDRIAKDQILVNAGDMATVAPSFARTVANNFCPECEKNLAGLNSESKGAVVSIMVTRAVSERREFLEKAAKLRVGGFYTHSNRSITMPHSGNNILASTVHELIHSLAHPAFRAAFGDEDLANEGFTQYFASEIEVDGAYPEQTAKVSDIKGLTNGPFLFDLGTGGSAEESLRLAYFSGRLDLIGWKPTSDAEKDAVTKAGGAAEWDPVKAKESAEKYKAAAVEKQDAHNNILGVGVYFQKSSGLEPTFNVRYARVVTQTQPYSRGRLLLEGQFIGSPVEKTLGGSLGIAGEYQDPYFFANAGARFIGEASLSGNPAKVDFSPFVGVGFRAWQRIRVGAEGFVLLPIAGGGSVQVGAGATVGVEF